MKLTPLKITLLYFLTGSLWIYFSDKVLLLFSDTYTIDELTLIQSYKGIFYISVTAILLFSLIYTYGEKVKKLNTDLVASEKTLFTLINNTDDLVWSVDKDFRLLCYNQSFLYYYSKISTSEINIGQNIFVKNLSEDSINKWKSYYLRGLNGERFSVEEFSPNTNQYLETSFNPIINENGQVTGVGCFSRNITKRKKDEIHIAQQNANLIEIANLQSHYVRKPLANILGLSYLFDPDAPNTDKNSTILKYIVEEASKLDLIITKIIKKSNIPETEIID